MSTSRLALAAALALTASACVRNPVTGRRQLSLVSEKDEIALGQESAAEVRQMLGIYGETDAGVIVSRVGKTLAANSQRPQLPWSFEIVDDPTPNAFALPGGPIFITRGMLAHLDSEAELAAVLGHEVGHVTAKHSVQMLTRAQLSNLALGVGSVLLPELRDLGSLARAGLSLLFLRYGRDAERQADDLAYDYLVQHQYDVRELSDVMKTLDRLSEEDQSRLPTWLASHPAPEDRLERIDARVARTQADWSRTKLGREEYLASIDGLVHGADPRQGFFRGNAFFHPSLGFELTFPQGWELQNAASAVIGVSPSQDAILLLSVAPGGTPSEAARKFLSQPGVETASPQSGTVNGLPVVATAFAAMTQQGPLEGEVAFVQHGGKTFELLAYAGAGNYAAFAPGLKTALTSFRPLTDPAAKDVKPSRIDLVRIDAAMDFAAFHARYGAGVPVNELARLNGVEPNAQLPAGTLLKRVEKGSDLSSATSRR